MTEKDNNDPGGGFFLNKDEFFAKYIPPWFRSLFLALIFSIIPVSMLLSGANLPLKGEQASGGLWGAYYTGGQDLIILIFSTTVAIYLWFRFFILLYRRLKK